MSEEFEPTFEEPVADVETTTSTDYDADPIYMDEDIDDGLNIVLDDTLEEEQEAKKEWFVIHCYSGYEKKVEHAILQRRDSMGMADQIFDVVIPTQEEIEIKDGKRRTVERRVFPGYILVEMVLNEDSWYVVRNTPGVTGFVGNGNEPTALRPEEVNKILKRMETTETIYNLDFKIGESVRIMGGPFNEFIGKVADIDPDRSKVKVMVDFFGRETPVELGFMEVEKV